MPWSSQVKKDLENAGTNPQEALDRDTYRKKVNTWEVQPENRSRRTGTAWSEDRKKEHGEKMKVIWARRKERRTTRASRDLP